MSLSTIIDRLRRHLTDASTRRAVLALVLAAGMSVTASYAIAKQRSLRATAGLNSAAQQLGALTQTPADDNRRAAIAWGYAERLRLGLESPFRLIEAAARDPRLTDDERRTVSWALLAHVTRGETHEVDPAALDGMGPMEAGRSAPGDQHVRLIAAVVEHADDPRVGELAIRYAYTLAVAERLLDGSAPILAAEAAAMIGDREIAKREALNIVRASNGGDPVDVVTHRRERRALYVERPTLLAPSEEMERDAVGMVAPILDSIRAMRATVGEDSTFTSTLDGRAIALAPRLYAAGALLPPTAALAVTVQRYMPLMRAQVSHVDLDALSRTRNSEMLVAVTRASLHERLQRRAVGRLLLAAGVAMRSTAQDPVWFPTDSAPSTTRVASTLGVAAIEFDRDVPRIWRPYYLQALTRSVGDLRRVLPQLNLDALTIRFRVTTPADSALALHDPRTRTLHLPIATAAGTLSHELAHDLDRQSAMQQDLIGYRSDIEARSQTSPDVDASADDGTSGRVAASLRALTEELSDQSRTSESRARSERPAEIFATRVDWFVASALARKGISSGFLSAVQDELLTGHVVHPERLRTSSRSRSLVDALEGMTPVAAFATEDRDPSVQTLLRWSLSGPVDRRVAYEILRGESPSWLPPRLVGDRNAACDQNADDARVTLVRMAAESRARGWLRLRARWTPESDRPAWARAILRQSPWDASDAEALVAQLRDYILIELSSDAPLPAGLGAYAAPLAAKARCGE